MKTSPIGRKLIQSFEGYRSEAYLCPAGVWTIGYGHTRDVKQGDICTKEEADMFLQDDLKTAEDAVNAQNLKIGQLQFDALVSFVFNVGTANFNKSTLLKKLGVQRQQHRQSTPMMPTWQQQQALPWRQEMLKMQ